MIFAYTALEISYLSRSSQLEAVARLKLKLRGQKLYEASMICAYHARILHGGDCVYDSDGETSVSIYLASIGLLLPVSVCVLSVAASTQEVLIS
jgi:hypothetical protein